LDAFRATLKDLGYVEGQGVLVETHWGNDNAERFPALARRVVADNPDVIVTGTSVGVAAFKRATQSIPVVFATAFNPVEQGFVSSLQRPGGNVTGVLVYADLTQKTVEIAREAFPAAKRLAILLPDSDPAHELPLRAFETSAARFNFEPLIIRVSRVDDLDRAFSELVARRAEALLTPQLQFVVSYRNQIIERALRARLPLVSAHNFIAEGGGLMSYGTLSVENYQRAAKLVDKILRGTRPAELPVEQPERFVLIVNRKTAKAIGVELSPVTMLRADRIID
jgi:putative ABC transport system substrate-binding protein